MHRITVALRHDVHGDFAWAKPVNLDLASQFFQTRIDFVLDHIGGQGQSDFAFQLFQGFNIHGHEVSPSLNLKARGFGHALVRGGGLEPPQYCYRQDLNLVRLPISPPARDCKTATGGLLHSPPA